MEGAAKLFWCSHDDLLMQWFQVLQDQYYFIFLSSLLAWSPNGDDSLIHSLLIGDTSTTYITDVATRVTMTLY